MINRAGFIQKFITEPKKIGSITPSSSFLTKRMLEDLPWDNLDFVVELGAGTGVFTDYIAHRKSESCRVLIIEQDDKMREALQSCYPDFHFGSEAENLCRYLNEFDLPKADCIISGLPFALFPHELQDQVMKEIISALAQDGIFHAYQYSLHMWKTFESFFAEVSFSLEPLNVPPAFVYCCRGAKGKNF
jgi:phospholipid N-methyltransferase